jgi:hypothetical protein
MGAGMCTDLRTLRKVARAHDDAYPLHPENLVAEMNWRNRAACLCEDADLFFPIGVTGQAIVQVEKAKRVCRQCEVREE